jgi:hypothetical protein
LQPVFLVYEFTIEIRFYFSTTFFRVALYKGKELIAKYESLIMFAAGVLNGIKSIVEPFYMV